MNKQTRRQFIKSAAVAMPFTLAASLDRQRAAKQPNIIYVFADQMRAHVLGCYGNKIVPTPNLDSMAKAGVTFDNAMYDNLNDPQQLNNLINKPEHAELQARLEKRMRELMKEAGDPGDTDKITAYRETRRGEDRKSNK